MMARQRNIRRRNVNLRVGWLERRDVPTGGINGIATPNWQPVNELLAVAEAPTPDHDPGLCQTFTADPKLKAIGPFVRPPASPILMGTLIGGPAGVFAPTPVTWSPAVNGMPILNSSPSSPVAIYLDFDGHGSNLPYDTDGNGAVFGASEQADIYEVWRQVAVYYSMFDVNVTTIQPTGVPICWQLISPSISGGYAFVGAFPNSQPQGFNQASDARTRISGIVHEIGHNMILSHQSDYNLLGVKTAEYSSGYSMHGPIMGVDYAQTIHKFFVGHPSSSASALQDDLALLANEIRPYQPAGSDGYRPDEHSSTTAMATQMLATNGYFSGWGVIERLTDVDMFSFTSAGGLYNVTANANNPSSLDAKLEVFDAAGNRLATADSAANDQNLVLTLPAGTYYVTVSSHLDYADVGAYFVSARPLPAGWSSQDIGSVIGGGHAGVDVSNGVWRVGATGSDIGSTSDNFRFAYVPLTGDGSITARVNSLTNTASGAKAGVMMRESLSANSINAFTRISPSGAAFQRRTSGGGSTTSTAASGTAPYWVRLSRVGSTITSQVSSDGNTWSTVGTATINFSSTLLVGLGVVSANTGIKNTFCEAVFDNVTITGNTTTPPPTYNGLPAPTGLTLTLGTGTGIDVSWTAVAGATGYAIERSADGAIWSQISTTTGNGATSFSNTGLTGGLRYFYRASSRDGSANNSIPSAVSSIVNRPSAPTNFSVTSLSTTQLVLNWRETGGESGYRVERSTDGGTNWTVVTTVGRNVPSFANTGLSYGTTYTYRVIPTSPDGDGVATGNYTTSTRINPVTGLVMTSVAANQIALNWSAVTGATGYRVQRSNDGTNFTTVTNVASPGYTDAAVNPQTEYYYRVAATNQFSESTSQPTVFAGTPSNPGLPSPWVNADVGTVGGKGAGGLVSGTFTGIGAGLNVTGTSDSFNFTYQALSGNGSITARVATAENSNANARAGIMIRETTGSNSRVAFLGLSPTAATGLAWTYRTTTGGTAVTSNTTNIGLGTWLRLTRSGSTFSAERSANGTTWTSVGSITIAMATNAIAGLVTISGTNSLLATATYTNVSVGQNGVPSKITQSTPTGNTVAPVDQIEFQFSQAMNTASFDPIADIVSATGPGGNLISHVTGFSWPNANTLRVNLNPQVVPGKYSMTIGPNILSSSGAPLDQNGNGIAGEGSDTYTASFSLGKTTDAFGYAHAPIGYDPSWVLSPGDSGVVALSTLGSADDASEAIDLGTNVFRFYGIAYNQLFVSTNGLVSFGTGVSASVNSDLTNSPQTATIAGLWDNLVTDRNSATDDVVLYKFFDLDNNGSADRLVVAWRNVHYSQQSPTSGDDGISFQTVLELNTGSRSGDMAFNYTDLTEAGSGNADNGNSATVGIKDVGIQGSNRVLVAQDGSAPSLVGNGKAVRVFVNRGPSAEAGGPYMLGVNNSVSLSGLASSDPDQSAASLYYLWDLDGDGTFGESGSAATRGDENGPTPTFNGAGVTSPTNVNLRVFDDFGLVATDAATINPRPPATVAGTVVNDGAIQRSQVRQLTVTFSEIVTLPSDPSLAFSLVGSLGPVPFMVTLSGTTQTVATLDFAGIYDGLFTLTAVASSITNSNGQALDGDGDGLQGDDYSFAFHRLFGDADGDRDVDTADFNAFRAAFGGNSSTFDIDNDGDIDTNDFFSFRVRFGSTI